MCSVPPRALSPLHGARCPPLAHSRIPRIQGSQGEHKIHARRVRSSARIDANWAAVCMVGAAMGGVIFHIKEEETTMFPHRARKISKSGRARSARSSAQSSSSVHGGVEACGGGGGGARAAGDCLPSNEAARRRMFAWSALGVMRRRRQLQLGVSTVDGCSQVGGAAERARGDVWARAPKLLLTRTDAHKLGAALQKHEIGGCSACVSG